MSRDGISAFLLARITEDEARAEAAAVAWTGSRPPDGMEWSWDVLSTEREATIDQDRHVIEWWPGRVFAECAAKRAIVELHDAWPVLMQQPVSFTPDPKATGNTLVYQVSQQIAWLTQAEYIARFGTEPPAAPMLRVLAAVYKDHPDYLQEWAEA